ncbi:hypothetical protein GE09DRAFT_1218773 [Coniochaeta sp. 2T2.1]|nr:hypothetical protein GE09DRAFT_1218773 [Coniochaeta sp. 2T2.1]
MPFGLPNPLKGKSKRIYRALPDSPSSPSFPKPATATAAPKPKPYNRNTLYDPAPNLNPPLAPTPAPAPARPRHPGRPGSSSSTACLPGTPRHGPLIDLDPYSGDEEDDTTARQVGELRVEMRELGGLDFGLEPEPKDEEFVEVDAPSSVREEDGRGKGKPAEFGNTALDMLRGARNDAAWRVRLQHQDDLKRKKEEAMARMRSEVENEKKKIGYLAGIGAPPTDQEGDSVLFDSDEFAELEENVFEDEGMEVVEYDDDDEEEEKEANDKKKVGDGKKRKGKYNPDLTRGSRGRYRADPDSSVSSHSSDDSWCSTSDIAPSDDEEEAPADASKEKKKKTLAAKLLSLARKKTKKAAAAAKPKAMDAALAEMVSEEAGAWAEVSESPGLEEMRKMGVTGEGMSTEGRRGGGGSGDEVDLVVDENYFA